MFKFFNPIVSNKWKEKKNPEISPLIYSVPVLSVFSIPLKRDIDTKEIEEKKGKQSSIIGESVLTGKQQRAWNL